MICPFNSEERKVCNDMCQYYKTCTRSEYRKKESKEDGDKKNS